MDTQKKLRDQILQYIIVAVDGYKLQGDPKSQDLMNKAINAASVLGQTQVDWILANNSTAKLTVEQLKHALALAMAETGQIYFKAKAGNLTFDDLRQARAVYEAATKK